MRTCFWCLECDGSCDIAATCGDLNSCRDAESFCGAQNCPEGEMCVDFNTGLDIGPFFGCGKLGGGRYKRGGGGEGKHCKTLSPSKRWTSCSLPAKFVVLRAKSSVFRVLFASNPLCTNPSRYVQGLLVVRKIVTAQHSCFLSHEFCFLLPLFQSAN